MYVNQIKTANNAVCELVFFLVRKSSDGYVFFLIH